MIKPLFKNVVIKQLEAEKKTASGIYLADNSIEKPMLGTVIATASDVVQVGQKVYYKKWGGSEIEDKGEKYLIIEEQDVLAIYE